MKSAPIRACRPLLTTLCTTLALCATVAAQAATPAHGAGCAYNGRTSADGGGPFDVLSNPNVMDSLLCGGQSIESHGTVYGSQWTGDYYFDYSFAQGGKTQTSAAAGLGVLRATSYSSATSDPKDYFYTANSGESVAIDNVYRSSGASSASSYWYDEITVNAGTQYGPVVLKFSLTLSGTESVTPGHAGLADIAARFIYDDDRYPGYSWIDLTDAGSTSATAGFWPGTVIKLRGDLSARTEVQAGGRYLNGNGQWVTGQYIATAEAMANAANTAGFQVEVLTAGASYSSASGHSYVTAVPEPASVWLLGIGALGVLGGVARRRRSSAALGH